MIFLLEKKRETKRNPDDYSKYDAPTNSAAVVHPSHYYCVTYFLYWKEFFKWESGRIDDPKHMKKEFITKTNFFQLDISHDLGREFLILRNT